MNKRNLDADSYIERSMRAVNDPMYKGNHTIKSHALSKIDLDIAIAQISNSQDWKKHLLKVKAKVMKGYNENGQRSNRTN